MVINIIIAFLAIFLSALLGYWAQDRRPPTVIESVRVIGEPVRPGGNIKVEYKVNRLRPCKVKIEQSVYDNENIRFTARDEEFTTAPGGIGPDVFVQLFHIPDDATPGKARYYGVRSYTCNPIHYWLQWPVVVLVGAEFEIAKL